MFKVGTRVGDRFIVERLLGEGGLGIVFEALDEARGERVALKTLGRIGGEAIYRLKKEFRVLVDLVHPNLVRLHELFIDDDLSFFSMQRVHGVPFVEYVRSVAPPLAYAHTESAASSLAASDRRPDGALDELRLRAAMLALVEGVEAIHRAGKMHRDLKPSNVLVDREGRVTILDFGLVEPDRPDATASQQGAGTPGYMAPEQMRQNGVCPESDWYALGAMLYEALTGELPFPGNAYDVIRAKARMDPAPDPRTIALDAPEDLSALARDLLAPQPEERPKPAQIRMRLGDGNREAPASIKPLFIGRYAELSRLEAAFDTRPDVIAVRGLSGIGKSALIERFLARVKKRSPDAVVLSGRCYEREFLPFKALDPIVDELSRCLHRMDAIDAALVTPRDASELCRLFPVLARVRALSRASAGRAPVTEPAEARRRAFEALRELFARLAEARPVVIAIDDMQWGDLDSGWLLSRLVAQPEAPKLLVVLGYRADEESRSPLLAHLASGAAREFIDLAPLCEEESRELAAKLLPRAGSSAALAIARESGGSPFFIRALASNGEGPNVGSASLDDVITAQIAKLDPAARSLLEVVSVAGTPISQDRALRAAALARADDAGIPLLRAASLLRTTNDESLVAYHDRIREAVVAGLDETRRREIHRALARVIDEVDVDALALHHREAGDREEALRFTLLAVDRATSALAAGRAASLLRQALSLSPRGDVRRTLRARLAEALADAGHAEEAADLYLELARETNDVSLDVRAASELTIAGMPARGLEVVRLVTKRLGIWMPRSPNLAVVVGVLWLVYLHVVVVRRRALVRLDAQTLARVEALQTFSMSLSLIEPPHALYLGTRAVVLAYHADDEELRGLALTSAASTLAFVRPFDARVDAHLANLAQLPNPDITAIHPFASGIVHVMRGEWGEGDDSFALAEARPYSGRLSYGAYLVFVRTWRLWTLYFSGRIRELARLSAGAVADARTRGQVTYLLAAMQVAAVGWLAFDDVEKAEGEIDEAFQSWHRAGGKTLGFSPTVFWEATARTLLDIYRGSSDVPRHYDSSWPAIERSGILRSPLIGLTTLSTRSFGLIEKASQLPSSERAPLLATVEADAHRLERNPIGTAAALAASSRAAVAWLRDDRTKARRALARAVALYDAAGARAFAASARYWLGGAERDAAIAFMGGEGIVRPDRFAQMLAPGFATSAQYDYPGEGVSAVASGETREG